ncbi:NAD(P)H-dependent glycerol-3-phosphate dehydrogenase [Acidithiobacillus caldus]
MSHWLVCGAGHWGTALAVYLAGRAIPTQLWGHRREHLPGMGGDLAPIFPGVPLPASLQVTAELEPALTDAEVWLIAVPSHALRGLLRRLRGSMVPPPLALVLASKGLELDTGARLDEVVAEEFPGVPLLVLSGPSFAQDMLAGRPLAMTLAGRDDGIREAIRQRLRSAQLRLYPSADVAGVCLAGAIKNVLAIAAGICDGLGLGESARAALITRGLAELQRIGTALGGQPETFTGLAGAGDLILTASSDLSRNRRLGVALGQGLGLEAARAQIGEEVEGVRSSRALYGLALRLGVEAPISEQVYRVLYQGESPQRASVALMQRGLEGAAPITPHRDMG